MLTEWVESRSGVHACREADNHETPSQYFCVLVRTGKLSPLEKIWLRLKVYCTCVLMAPIAPMVLYCVGEDGFMLLLWHWNWIYSLRTWSVTPIAILGCVMGYRLAFADEYSHELAAFSLWTVWYLWAMVMGGSHMSSMSGTLWAMSLQIHAIHSCSTFWCPMGARRLGSWTLHDYLICATVCVRECLRYLLRRAQQRQAP